MESFFLAVFLSSFLHSAQLKPIDQLKLTDQYLKNPVYNLSCWIPVHMETDGQYSPGCTLVRNGVKTIDECSWRLDQCLIDIKLQGSLDRSYCIRSFLVHYTTNNTFNIELEGASCYRTTYTLATDGECTPDCRVKIVLGKSKREMCCCTEPMCNRDFHIDMVNALDAVPRRYDRIVIPVLTLSALAAVAFLIIFKQKRNLYKHNHLREDGTSEEKEMLKAKPLLDFSQLELKELCGNGSFGHIYRAVSLVDGSTYAVKVFGAQEKSSWLNEKEIYNLLYKDTRAFQFVLGFYGGEKIGVDEYWIVTVYHKNGSLFDYLTLHGFITLKNLLHLTSGIVNGLAFLHERSNAKPSIAHRDLKSKNIIIAEDLTARIADYGLAQVLDGNVGEIHSTVGTPRYMAPEVLEGAISFKPSAFLRIDMYAFALVLFEMVACCSDLIDKSEINRYELPFAFAGKRPSVEQMKEVVVVQQLRPSLPSSLTKSEMGTVLAQTIKECWDQDTDARISISCVKSRFNRFLFKGSTM